MSSVRHLERRRASSLPALLAASAVLTVPTLAYGDGVLPLGTEIADSIPPGVTQYYSYSTPVDGALTLTLGPTPGRNVQLGFAAPDQTLGAHGDAGGETYSVVVDNLKAGDYFAQLFLYGFSTDDPAAITLLATFEPAPLDVDPEPNDELAAALPLESGTQVTGHLGYDGFMSDDGYDAQDYYAIEVLEGGSLDATLQMAAASANNALQLHDASGATMESHDITLPADQVTIHRDGLPGGTYYLLAHQYGFGHGSYYLEATVTDPTGGPDGDVVLPLETPLDDVIAGATEEYYSVTTPVDGSLTLTVYPPEGRNVQLGFAAPDKTLGVHGDSGGVEYSVTVPNLRAGSYYAKLFTYGFTSDPPVAVTLLATFEPAPLAADAEPNGDLASALTLASGAEVTGHLGYDGFTSDAGYDDSDYYSIVVSEGGDLQATLRMEAASANNALQLLDAG
ncbi:MAG TPA: hypothetical protein PLU22_14440, partial [Polyangiaceae bacterium]|nr:hypothetical protein [Polyangiaceae bacterium]